MARYPVQKRDIVQIAYHVPDVEAAARQFSRLFGWGPFFVFHNIPLTHSSYRGRPAPFDHSSAYGQAGDIMVELIQQNNDAPSAIRDMFAPHEFGMHHAARFSEDMAGEIARHEAAGYDVALRAETETGVEFVMMDTRPLLGHMLELYPPTAALTSFYAMVRQSALEWDGRNPVRHIG